MKIPANILMAMSAAALSAGCLSPLTAHVSPAPEIVEVTESVELTEPAPGEAPATEQSSEAPEEPEHDPDYCPPCGRG